MKPIITYEPEILVKQPNGTPAFKLTGQCSDWVSDGQLLRCLRDQLPAAQAAGHDRFNMGELAAKLQHLGTIDCESDDGTHIECRVLPVRPAYSTYAGALHSAVAGLDLPAMESHGSNYNWGDDIDSIA